MAACVLATCPLAAWIALSSTPGPSGRAGAATSETCSFATPGTGTYASTLCWFDLSAYNAAAASSPAGQAMSVALPGGFGITFTLHVSGVAATPVPFPTYSGAYLGNNGHYTGVTGKPALYQNLSGTTTATLDNISVVDSSGAPMSGYAFVGADAESTDTNESITWTANTPLSLISNLGNACNSGTLLTGIGTTTVKCTATTSNVKTGTTILAAQTPSFLTQTMVGAGRQGVAFGVLVSTVQLTTTFASRADPGDTAAVLVSSSSGSVLASAATGTGASATTGPLTVLTSNESSDYVLSQQLTSGLASNYTTSWSCTRNGVPDPNLPSGDAGPTATVSLGIGDFVNCTVTYSALPATLTLDKEAGTPVDVNQDGLTDAGDTIAYTFTVTNTGALTMSNIAVSDPKVGPVTCPQPTLDPGESEVCTAAPYTVTAADDAAGAVDNTATASGTPPGSTTPVTSPPSSTSTPAAVPDPAVSLVKTANSSVGDTNPLEPGDTVTWSYLVTNTGNVNLTSVTVDDPTLPPGVTVTCPSFSLANPLVPGDSVTCTTSTFTVATAGITLTDTATATGDSPDGPSPPSDPSTVTVPTAMPDPVVALEKTAAVAPATDQDGYRLGDTITYSYVVTNTGNVTLASVAVDDPTLGPVSCPAGSVLPGDSVTCTAAPYAVTQADMDAGHITDTATAVGTDPSGVESPPATASVTVPADAPDPAVSLTKTAAVTPAADQHGVYVDDTIAYSYVVTNTGNVTLASVAVDDPTLGAVTCPGLVAPGLAPGASVTCTASPAAVAQGDVDAGEVTDTATATGTDTTGDPSPPSDPSTVTIPAVSAPRVSIVKSAFVSPLADQHGARLGDTIAYSYLVTNIGDVSLTSVAVHDPTLGKVTCPSLPSRGLGPQGTVTCTADATHVVTTADVDAGKVTDTATATGIGTVGGQSPPSDPSTVTIPTVSSPSPPPTSPPGSTPGAPPGSGTSPGSAPGATGTAVAATTALGLINSGLGRWSPASPGNGVNSAEVLGGALAVAAAGVALVLLRRRDRRPRHARPAGRARWAGTAVVLVAGATLVVVGAVGPLGSNGSPPNPAPRSGSVSLVAPGHAGAKAATNAKETAVATGTASLVVPALHVDAPLLPIGAVGSPGSASLSIPNAISDVGWWDGVVTSGSQETFEPAPAPGMPGTAIIAGHVDSAAVGPGALYHLGAATVGDRVEVVGLNGATTAWRVTAPPTLVHKAQLPPSLFATTGPPRLALVTCGGPFDSATGHYEDNVIVWAEPAGPV